MDFQLYSLGAALVFHEIFFPESSTAMALILAMGTYGAGYVARIVGAFIFGKMGDRIGRKKVLFITITMMGICTTLIGVLPTYAQIGVFAPILLVTLRIIPVSYTHLRAHETRHDLVCRLLLEKKKKEQRKKKNKNIES